MGFYVDLETISMDDYREILKNADLLPSRILLKDDIDEKFDELKKQQIESVEDLRKVLSNKKKLQAISEQSGISEDYLKILIREVKSYRQKPTRIQDFPEVSDDTIQKLGDLGIKNAFQLFEHILTKESRAQLSRQTGISEDEILRLTRLVDLSRIRWVNHTFAYVLLEAGYDTADRVAKANHKELYEAVKELNEKRQIYKGHIGLHDMKLTVEAARDVSHDIEY
jgi:hypothetical protein